jgi:ATP-dependent DNA ligase
MNDFFDVSIQKTYPKLYSRDTTGKIRVWWMEQDNEKYRTHAGVEGGQIVTTEWTVAVGKNKGKLNETTDIDQAKAEVLAKYKKQRETGYFDDVKDVDVQQYFQPMLAHKWPDYKDEVDWKDGHYVSPKLDGLRCVITKDGCFSRNGKRFVSFPHIPRELKPLFDKDPNLILDGEVYTHKLKNDFNKIISLAKKTKPTPADLKESEQFLQYWIFDCPSIPGTFAERYAKLKRLILDNFRDNKWIRLVIHTHIKSEADLERLLQEWLAHGFEGAMINIHDGTYQNKRTRNLLKYKLFKDDEYEIVDILEGIGNRSGMFGKALLKDKRGTTFEANARGNEDFYKRLLREKSKLIGLKATVRYQNLTPDEQVPRFGVIVDIRDYE